MAVQVYGGTGEVSYRCRAIQVKNHTSVTDTHVEGHTSVEHTYVGRTGVRPHR